MHIYNPWDVQPIPLGVTISNALSKVNAQSSNVFLFSPSCSRLQEMYTYSFCVKYFLWESCHTMSNTHNKHVCASLIRTDVQKMYAEHTLCTKRLPQTSECVYRQSTRDVCWEAVACLLRGYDTCYLDYCRPRRYRLLPTYRTRCASMKRHMWMPHVHVWLSITGHDVPQQIVMCECLDAFTCASRNVYSRAPYIHSSMPQ